VARAAKKKPDGGETAKKKTSSRKKSVEPGSRGLDPVALPAAGAEPELAGAIEADGGAVLARYRDPLGGHTTLLASLPLDRVEPTPFQRDLSPAHVKKLSAVIEKLGWFLDPIIAVRRPEGRYWTPNGYHRMSAMKELGAKSIVALVVPDAGVAYKILALNTEKAHNVREKALEVIRMARSLADLDASRPESDYALEFEEPSLLTLGACYEQRPRFSGGAYGPVLRRVDAFLDAPMRAALATRGERAAKVLALDEAVNVAIEQLKAKGFESPYLRAFVVARINPLRFKKDGGGEFDDIIETMTASARKFDAAKVSADQLAAASGPPEE